MDELQFCKNVDCGADLPKKAIRCPNCGSKTARGKKGVAVLVITILWVVATILVLMAAFKQPDPEVALEALLKVTVTEQTTATLPPTNTPIPTEIVFPEPQGKGWYAQTAARTVFARGGNGCLKFDNSIRFCAGEKVEVFVRLGYWHVVWTDKSGEIVKTIITPGKIVSVSIPSDATSISFGNMP